MDALEDFFDLVVGEVGEGVEIRADCAREENWVLRNDRETGSQVMELYRRDVDPIDKDPSFSCFEEAEEG